LLAELEGRDADDWRVVWYRGTVSLASGDHATAALSFDAVYDAFPGEPAPKLALAVCAEVLGQLDNAADYYDLVWTTDPSYVSAAFGLARVRLAAGDRVAAVEVLESVPGSSIHYTAARVAAVRARLRERAPYDPLFADLTAAAGQVEQLDGLGLDRVRRERLTAEVLGAALDWVLAGGNGTVGPPTSTPTSTPTGAPAGVGSVSSAVSGTNTEATTGTVPSAALLGNTLDERGLRFGLERSYRTLARLSQSGAERIELVERANRFRPRTWV
jgi:serine/threonine-protein kinase PknG